MQKRNLFPYRFRYGRTIPEELDWDYLLKVQAEKEQIRREKQELERAAKEHSEKERESV